MSRVAWLICAAGTLAALFGAVPKQSATTLVVAGRTLGYLSPCGCTEPMTGGIVRMGSAIDAIRRSGPDLLLYDGGFVSGQGRQDLMKAQTLAQALGEWGVAASNLSVDDAKLGEGELLSLSGLMGGRMITDSLMPSGSNGFPSFREQSGFLVFGVSQTPEVLAGLLDEKPKPLEASVLEMLHRASTDHQRAVMLLDGDQREAETLAKRFPLLMAIVYRSDGKPPPGLESIGNVDLLTSGEKGQYLVSLATDTSHRYRTRALDPSVPDDPATQRIYGTYLKRVDRSGLWAEVPRISGPAYAGSQACRSCHQSAYDVWVHSDHAKALATLEGRGHGRDPECLPCHIVGGAYRSGYQSRQSTPDLANVGCESCHGAGALHVADPSAHRFRAVSNQTCVGCHELLNSPNFDFDTYWPKIRH